MDAAAPTAGPLEPTPLVVFGTQRFERATLAAACAAAGIAPEFLEASLTPHSAALAAGFRHACCFVNDDLGAKAMQALAAAGVRHVTLRSAGFNHVDREAAARCGIALSYAPDYSPYAVAEHAVALMLTLNRRTHRASQRVREGNYALDGLTGFDLHGKTVGIVGTGRIGRALARIMMGFDCRVLAVDPVQDPLLEDQAVGYTDLATLFRLSDIVSLHCPLNASTHHLVNAHRLAEMKPGAMLINTGRGALIDTRALIAALKQGRPAYLGLDVYEFEGPLFFRDRSYEVLQDDLLARLLTFPNVLITAHQGFLTREALEAIARTVAANVAGFERGAPVQPVPGSLGDPSAPATAGARGAGAHCGR